MDNSTGASPNALAASQAAQSTGSHRRTYQACIPCRKRKVRCDLGPVDDPHDPPCQRCRRESKECYFSATRRKRRWSGGEDAMVEDGETDDAPAAYNVRKKSARTSGAIHEDQAPLADSLRSVTSHPPSVASPLDHYGLDREPNHSTSQYTVRGQSGKAEDGQDQEVANETAAALFQSPITSPGDALHLLLQASGQSEDFQNHLSLSHGKSNPSPQNAGSTVKHEAPRPVQIHRPRLPPQPQTAAIDPAIAGLGTSSNTIHADKSALNIWSRVRFVRAGWFTAKEAIAYIDYYYQYLAPLTPISPPDIRQVNRNPDILSEEPMLVVTLLTIASRYMRLPGPGGQTRCYMVHERLWMYLQNMITRMFWGQEQYGSGFPLLGARRRGCKPADKGGLRALGTIESLLLLSDFHPRSMHFPPAGDDEEIIAPILDDRKDVSTAPDEDGDMAHAGSSTLGGWTEPALRSDRMTWSLIGLSHALAYELGVFGTYTEGVQNINGRLERPKSLSQQSQRADRIERLLYIYITQACGRFGFPIVYSDHFNKFNLSKIDYDTSEITRTIENQSQEDQIQGYWVEMAAINKACNETLFLSKSQTATFIQTGEYIERLRQLQPLTQKWQSKIMSSTIAKYSKLSLLIDLHYFRLYNNGLALQAVLEQWTTKYGEGRQGDSPQTPGSTLSSHFASLYSRNEPYIKEVIDASRTILKYVVYDLLPNDFLKHATVRMYFRILSAAMFLLKTFALGGRLNEIRISLRLLEGTIKAFRTSVVDDVHLCLRIADLLENLTSAIGNKFVRLPPQVINSPQTSKSSPAHQGSFPDPFISQANHNEHLPAFSDENDNSDQAYGFMNPMGGIPHTHTDPNDASIAIMPPPGGSYSNFDLSNHTHTANRNTSSTNARVDRDDQTEALRSSQLSPNSHHHHQQQQSPSPYHIGGGSSSNNGNSNNNNPILFPSEEDWLTLDLQPLFDPSSGFGGMDNDLWYGAFGPETHNNLEVLGKLVNEQWQPGDFGF